MNNPNQFPTSIPLDSLGDMSDYECQTYARVQSLLQTMIQECDRSPTDFYQVYGVTKTMIQSYANGLLDGFEPDAYPDSMTPHDLAEDILLAHEYGSAEYLA